MSTNTRCAALVVGAGPSGLTMACELARYGIPFRIIDEKPESTRDSSAVAIFPRTLETFEIMGMALRIQASGQRLERISVSDGTHHLAELNFDDMPSRHQYVIGLPQNETERLLTEQLAGFQREVEWGTALAGFAQDDHGVRATLRRGDGDAESLEIPWLIGCDGAHSGVREILGIGFEGEPCHQSFVLADVTMDPRIDESRAHVFFSPAGLLALFPFGRGRYRVVARVEPSLHDADAPPEFEEIRQYVWQRSPITAEIREVTWAARFRVAAQKLAKFQHGRVFFCGDAAHTHSPAGAQGMNTGIQDSFNLAWKLAYVAEGSAPETFLESYDAEREPVARGVLHLTDNITHVATTQNANFLRARSFLLPVLSSFDTVSHQMAERLAELTISYRHSPIVAGAYGRLRGGDRIPDLEFVSSEGARIRLYQIVAKARRPILLVVGGGHTEAADWILEIPKWFADLVPSWAVAVSPVVHLNIPSLVDAAGLVHETAGTSKMGLLLIRPDAYVGYASEDWDFKKLDDHLALSFPS